MSGSLKKNLTHFGPVNHSCLMTLSLILCNYKQITYMKVIPASQGAASFDACLSGRGAGVLRFPWVDELVMIVTIWCHDKILRPREGVSTSARGPEQGLFE